jgi:hypothetical protein
MGIAGHTPVAKGFRLQEQLAAEFVAFAAYQAIFPAGCWSRDGIGETLFL